MNTAPAPMATTRAAPPAIRPTGALEPVSASGGVLSLGVGCGVAGGVDSSGGTSGVVGGVEDGLGVVGGAVVPVGGVLSAGVVGVLGVVGSDGDGLGVSGVLGVHAFSPPFHAAIR